MRPLKTNESIKKNKRNKWLHIKWVKWWLFIFVNESERNRWNVQQHMNVGYKTIHKCRSKKKN